jgi:hypothetical protein
VSPLFNRSIKAHTTHQPTTAKWTPPSKPRSPPPSTDGTTP